jgi:hypothetical protein
MIKPTFENFLTHKQLVEVAENATIQEKWDFFAGIGDTIKEKYEDLYFQCHNLNNRLLKESDAQGYFWIVTSPEIGVIFEICDHGFKPNEDLRGMIGGVVPQGFPSLNFKGTVNAKWRLYTDLALTNEIIMGCNDKQEPFNHYACLHVENLVV